MIILGSSINPFGKRNRILHNTIRKDFTVAGDTLASIQSYLKDRPKFSEYSVFIIYKDSHSRRSTDKNAHRIDQFVVEKITITYNVSKTTQKQVIHTLYLHVSLKDSLPGLFKNLCNHKTKNVSFTQFNRFDPANVANKLDTLFQKGTPLSGILSTIEPQVLRETLDFVSIPAVQNQIEVRLIPNL